MLVVLLSGAAGGLIRGLVGFTKHQFAYKNVPFKPGYFTAMMLVSAVIGTTVTWAVIGSGIDHPFIQQINPPLAFVIGYAGGDFIENIYKILLKKTTLFPLPDDQQG